jgi:hypothetical protein
MCVCVCVCVCVCACADDMAISGISFACTTLALFFRLIYRWLAALAAQAEARGSHSSRGDASGSNITHPEHPDGRETTVRFADPSAAPIPAGSAPQTLGVPLGTPLGSCQTGPIANGSDKAQPLLPDNSESDEPQIWRYQRDGVS